MKDYQKILLQASHHLKQMQGQVIDVVEVKKPATIEYAYHLTKVISKLSPLVGNMIEFNVCEELNKLNWRSGKWKRQDPAFPDTIFDGGINPAPGIEIKTWFPLATEITARFKESVNHFQQNQTYVALVAWMPEFIIYGKPRIVGIWIDTALSLAKVRDKHYHNPPDYLVFEPEDTSTRTANLQQTNTNGYKFQGDKTQFKEAQRLVALWGQWGKVYSPNVQYQSQLKKLLGRYPYRLDTNYAKIDRIQHKGLEDFKAKLLEVKLHGHTLKKWSKLIQRRNENALEEIINLV